ncbi:hypothetical protein DCO56_28845 [Sphingobacterium athyrii]|uniref:Glycine zipper domain-containing protein n=2 Tax=Sphingobacterium athyrii TaxID=2152717 RepID=A0A363NJW3_9SPHI|nr:hypothetical protein DCO56_28845 [Sphingobacterium athyrii]
MFQRPIFLGLGVVDNVSATMRLVDLRENNVASQNILSDALNTLGKVNDGISGLAEGLKTNGFNSAKLYIGQIRPSVAYGFRVYMKPVIQSNIGKSLSRTANIAGITISAATVANTYLEEGYRGPKTTMEMEMGKAATGMAGAWAGARIGAAAGGVLGSFFPILGNGVGAIAGGIIGGIAGGIGGSLIAEEAYN